MAQREVISLVDDLDGTDATETVEFGLDGVQYQIDLSDENAAELRDALAQYVEYARKVGGGRRRLVGPKTRPGLTPVQRPVSVRPDKEQNQAIRAWARKKGFVVSDRGRIPVGVVEAYHKK